MQQQWAYTVAVGLWEPCLGGLSESGWQGEDWGPLGPFKL